MGKALSLDQDLRSLGPTCKIYFRLNIKEHNKNCTLQLIIFFPFTGMIRKQLRFLDLLRKGAVKVKVAQSYPTLCDPMELYSPWNTLGQNTGVGSLSLLQGIFPTQGSNSGPSHCRATLYQLGHKGSPDLPGQPQMHFLPEDEMV